MKNFLLGALRSMVDYVRPVPRLHREQPQTPELSREKFAEMLAESLANPETRSLLLASLAAQFPVQGGACGTPAGDVAPGTFGSGCAVGDYSFQSGAKVGIGTGNPSEKLHVMGSALLSGGAGDVALKLDNSNYEWQMRHIASDGSLRFYYLQGALDALTVVRNGNVGIGTVAPPYRFSVVGTNFSGTAYIQDTEEASIILGATNNPSNSKYALLDYRAGKFSFIQLNDARQALNTRMVIDAASGNVGIGTTSPAEKLDVIGAIKSDGLNKIVFLRPSGGSSDGTMINNAIADLPSTGGIIMLTPGTYNINTTINITKSGVKLRGYGGTRPNGGYVNAVPLTKLLWTPATTGTMVQLNSAPPATPAPILDLELSDLTIDGADIADNGLALNRVVYSKFRNVHVQNLASSGSVGIKLTTTATASESNRIGSAWNLFEQCSVIKASQGVVLMRESGAASDTNSTHNTFIALSIEFHGTQSTDRGISLGDCDNNAFYSTWIFRRGTKGAGVLVEDPTKARSNYFYHLQSAKTDSDPSAISFKVEKADSPDKKNLIFGYDLENQQGQPVATKTDGTPANASDFLFWIDSQGKIHGGQIV